MPHLTQQIAAYEQAGFASAGMFPVTWDHETLAVIEFDLLMVRRSRSPDPLGRTTCLQRELSPSGRRGKIKGWRRSRTRPRSL